MDAIIQVFLLSSESDCAFFNLNLIVWIVGEECPTIGFQPSSLEQIFHCAMCLKERIEDLVLGFRDHSNGSDDWV